MYSYKIEFRYNMGVIKTKELLSSTVYNNSELRSVVNSAYNDLIEAGIEINKDNVLNLVCNELINNYEFVSSNKEVSCDITNLIFKNGYFV